MYGARLQCARHEFAVHAKRYGIDDVSFLEHAEAFPRSHVPDPDGAVFRRSAMGSEMRNAIRGW